MPSNHLILCCPLLLLPSIFPSIRVFSNESVLCIRWPKYWSFRFSISPSNEYSGLISFRLDWCDIAAQQTLKILLQHHSSKASILQHSTFSVVQFSHLYMTTGKTSFDNAQLWMWLGDSAYEGYHIFLFLCLTSFTQNDNLQFRPCCCKEHYFILFNGWVIFHCTYEPHFHYPFLCWWPRRLLLCLCYSKQHCNEHWGTHTLSDHVFLQMYLGHRI